MTHFAGKAVRTLILTVATVLILTASAFAAEDALAVAVGSTTGSSLRLRSKASTSSSIVRVLEKGTAVAVLDKNIDGWYKIAYEGKTGYVSADYMILDRDNRFTTYGRVNGDSVNVRAEATTQSKVNATLTQGTLVTVNGFVDGWYDITCKYGTKGYIRSDFLDLTESDAETVVKTAAAAEPAAPVPASENGGSIADFAKQYLGVHYVWGGASAKGFDCSGFTMYVYKQFGYSLPHTASGQWASGLGSKVSTVGELQPGDLVFFNDPSRNAGKACSHAGIYVGNGQFIHASSAKNGVIYSDITSGYYNRYFKSAIRF